MTTYHRVLKIMLGVIAFTALLSLWLLVIDGTVVNRPNDLSQTGTTYRQTTQLTYRAGDPVYVTYDVCVYRPDDATIQWQLTDARIIFFSARPQPILQTGCTVRQVLVESLPLDITPDTYRFVGTLSVRVNAVRTITYQLQTNEFHVIK
jgi:hypothetical protein